MSLSLYYQLSFSLASLISFYLVHKDSFEYHSMNIVKQHVTQSLSDDNVPYCPVAVSLLFSIMCFVFHIPFRPDLGRLSLEMGR